MQPIAILKPQSIQVPPLNPATMKHAHNIAKGLTGKDIIFSKQNLDWFSWCANGKGSGILEALAGTGKTFSGIIGGLLMGQNILYLAFNNAAAGELQEKLDILGIGFKQAQARTCHSLGFRILKATFPELNTRNSVNPNKVRDLIIKELTFTKNTDGTPKNKLFFENKVAIAYSGVIAKLVSYAQQRGLGIVGNIEDESAWYDIIDRYDALEREENAEQHAKEIVQLAIAALNINNTITNVVSFDDQIYLPLKLKCKIPWRYATVIMDEGQDANPVRMMLARAVLMAGGRFAAMGDKNQSIYAFTGAEYDALDQLKKAFNCVTFPLTVTRRCPKAVVRCAQEEVPEYEAHEDAAEGEVFTIKADELFANHKADMVAGNAILCRNTAPLIELAFRCLRNGIPMIVEGRKIAEGLKALANRWKVKNLDTLKDKLEKYFEQQKTKLTAAKKEDILAAIEDKVESLYVIIEQCQLEKKYTLTDLNNHLDKIFADTVDEKTGKIIRQVFTGCTGHKSKGREWEKVFLYGFNRYNPSPWARKKEDVIQENNLIYVMKTRAKKSLIFVHVPTKAEEKAMKNAA